MHRRAIYRRVNQPIRCDGGGRLAGDRFRQDGDASYCWVIIMALSRKLRDFLVGRLSHKRSHVNGDCHAQVKILQFFTGCSSVNYV